MVTVRTYVSVAAVVVEDGALDVHAVGLLRRGDSTVAVAEDGRRAQPRLHRRALPQLLLRARLVCNVTGERRECECECVCVCVCE